MIGKKKNFIFEINTFDKINKVQGALIGYLKMKYPRAGNLFVPGDLMDKFKSFSMTEKYQNDILTKC